MTRDTMADAGIGVFDSGVGGLSILKEIRAQLPAEHLIYVADSAAAPYGDRTEQFIADRVEALVEFFLDQGAKAIVVACNTATAVAVKTIRSKYDIPVIAVEPAVKPATKLTQTGVIGVLATSRTLASDKFARLTKTHGAQVKVLLQPCPGFVEQVEKGALNSAETLALVKRYISPLLDKDADTLVLGCTHYPFLRETIRQVAGEAVHVVDSSTAVAKQVRRRLERENLLSGREDKGAEVFYTSGVPLQVEPVVAKLWGRRVKVLPLPKRFCPKKED